MSAIKVITVVLTLVSLACFGFGYQELFKHSYACGVYEVRIFLIRPSVDDIKSVKYCALLNRDLVPHVVGKYPGPTAEISYKRIDNRPSPEKTMVGFCSTVSPFLNRELSCSSAAQVFLFVVERENGQIEFRTLDVPSRRQRPREVVLDLRGDASKVSLEVLCPSGAPGFCR